MLLSQKLEEGLCANNDATSVVAKFLLKEKRNVENYSMQEIADLTYTSRPTLVRIAKKMGFLGWSEFIKEYVKEMYYLESHFTDINPNIPFEETDSIISMANKISVLKIESNIDTVSQMDEKTIEKCIDIMFRAKRVCIFAISINNMISQLFKRKMALIGKNIELLSQSEQRFQANSLSEDDCAIIISYSGNNEDRMPTSFLEVLKKNNVPIIGITGMGENLVRQHSDCILTISSREKLYSKIATFVTEESISLILDILYCAYFKMEYEKNLNYKISLSREVESHRFSTLKESMEYTDTTEL